MGRNVVSGPIPTALDGSSCPNAHGWSRLLVKGAPGGARPQHVMATYRRGRPPVLSRELILAAAFRVVDDESAKELTMTRLGRELGATPSAVYRHFRSKDDLLLAMADVMLEEALATFAESGSPVDNLRRLMWALRRSYLRRPGLAPLVYCRFTGGEAQTRAMLAVMHNLAELGYGQQECVVRGRAIEEMTFAHIASTADVVSLPTEIIAKEMPLARAYFLEEATPTPMSDAALRASVLEYADEVFHTMLEGYLVSVVVGAPTQQRRRKAVPGKQ